MHQPFRLDHKGFNKEINLKEWQKTAGNGVAAAGQGQAKIPIWWQKGTNPNRTYQEVQNNRRREFVPDISFDLDGDGQVGNRDLVISKLFDKDGDGKLNAEERKNAEEAIRNVSASLSLAKVFFCRVSMKRWCGMLSSRVPYAPLELCKSEE